MSTRRHKPTSDRSKLPKRPVGLKKFKHKWEHLPIDPNEPVFVDPVTQVRLDAMAFIQKAGVFRRILAFILDMVPVLAFWTATLWVVLQFCAHGKPFHKYDDIAGGIMWVVNAVFYVSWFGFFDSRFGGTPFKLLLCMRIVDAYGKPISFGKSILRSFIRVLDGLLILSVICALYVYRPWDGRFICDTSAGSQVVRA